MPTFDRPTLEGMLLEARLAKHRILTGKGPQSLGEANGFGSKSVTYSQVNMTDLDRYIQWLESQLGGGRSPIYIT